MARVAKVFTPEKMEKVFPKIPGKYPTKLDDAGEAERVYTYDTQNTTQRSIVACIYRIEVFSSN